MTLRAEVLGRTLRVVNEQGDDVTVIGDVSDPNAQRLCGQYIALANIVHRLCLSLASAGVEAKAGSMDPIEALHADALAAYAEATGIADPFGEAMRAICANNRAITAKARGETP